MWVKQTKFDCLCVCVEMKLYSLLIILLDLHPVGYYCSLGASDPAPTDNVTGAICPVGHYCPEGSPAPISCPTGYYLDSEENNALEDCLPCPLGEFCPGIGRETSAGDCDAGFYCPGGQNVSAPAEYV